MYVYCYIEYKAIYPGQVQYRYTNGDCVRVTSGGNRL